MGNAKEIVLVIRGKKYWPIFPNNPWEKMLVSFSSNSKGEMHTKFSTEEVLAKFPKYFLKERASQNFPVIPGRKCWSFFSSNPWEKMLAKFFQQVKRENASQNYRGILEKKCSPFFHINSQEEILNKILRGNIEKPIFPSNSWNDRFFS